MKLQASNILNELIIYPHVIATRHKAIFKIPFFCSHCDFIQISSSRFSIYRVNVAVAKRDPG